MSSWPEDRAGEAGAELARGNVCYQVGHFSLLPLQASHPPTPQEARSAQGLCSPGNKPMGSMVPPGP